MSRLIVLPLLFTGCMFSAMKQQNDAIKAQNAAAKANYEQAQSNMQSGKFISIERAWACPTEQAALTGTACDGGLELRKNREVSVIGQAPKAGVWPVAHYTAQGLQKMFIAASAVNELPDTESLDGYATDVATRYPEAKRIPLRDINFADLIEQPRAYKGYYLVLRQPSGDMSNKTFANGTFTFTIPIPVTTGSRWTALAQFELKNRELVGDFEKGGRSYQCGPKYCDNFVIVAELTGRTVDRVDEFGTVRRLPVFAIRELGDRYGTYKPQ